MKVYAYRLLLLFFVLVNVGFYSICVADSLSSRHFIYAKEIELNVVTGFDWVNDKIVFSKLKENKLWLCEATLYSDIEECAVDFGDYSGFSIFDLESTKNGYYIIYGEEYDGAVGLVKNNISNRKAINLSDIEWYEDVRATNLKVIDKENILIESGIISNIKKYHVENGGIIYISTVSEDGFDVDVHENFYYFSDYSNADNKNSSSLVSGIVRLNFNGSEQEQLTTGEDFSVSISDKGCYCFIRGYEEEGNSIFCSKNDKIVNVYIAPDQQKIKSIKMSNDGKYVAGILSNDLTSELKLVLWEVRLE